MIPNDAEEMEGSAGEIEGSTGETEAERTDFVGTKTYMSPEQVSQFQ